MNLPASARIPIAFAGQISKQAQKTLDEVERFVQEKCIPADAVFAQMLGKKPNERFAAHPQILEDLKDEAKSRGLWNLFLPKSQYAEGSGYSNLEYGLMAEQLGKSQIASEVCSSHHSLSKLDAYDTILQTMNCSAPDTGNMEVLAKFGNAAQKKEWLEPLLAGNIRSAFLMTEPDVASSDATNIQFEMKRDGDSFILNGSVSEVMANRFRGGLTLGRNGGAAAQATLDASSTLSWAKPTYQIPILIDNNPSSLCLQELRVLQFTVCSQYSATTMPPTVMDISPSKMFVSRHPALSWEKDEDSRLYKEDWVLAEFITLCGASVR
jgi:hypothetical protein